MKNFLISILSVVTIALGAALFVVLQQANISTIEIDRDRAAITEQVEAAQAESNQYSSGLLKSLLEVRIAILRNTQAMLDQKRASYIRAVRLNYIINSKSVREASDRELEDILEELGQAEKKAATSKIEAEKYSGGLLQSLSLLKAETDQLSISQLRLKFYSAKHGIPMPIPSSPPPAVQEKPSSNIVKDREAL